MQFGLPLAAPDRPRTERLKQNATSTYTTSLADSECRAIAGCVWCQFLTDLLRWDSLWATTDHDGLQTITISAVLRADRKRLLNIGEEQVQVVSVRNQNSLLYEGNVHADAGV